MLGRLAGLRSAKKQRRLGWPNLKLATAMRKLRASWRRARKEFDRLGDLMGWNEEEREREWEAAAGEAERKFQALISDAPPQPIVRGRAVTVVDSRARGMSLLEARRRGLVR